MINIADELIINRIYIIRGQKVMLDEDLAELYMVTTGNSGATLFSRVCLR